MFKKDKNIIMDFQQILKDEYKDFWTFNDLTVFEQNIIKRAKSFTMTSPERMISLIRSTEYLVDNNISGDIVECGVWKGGSMMIIALVLLEKKCIDKVLYLYDTFEGMVEPELIDESSFGEKAILIYNDKKGDQLVGSDWCNSNIEQVKKNLYSTGYPKDKIIFVKGRVEETIPQISPNEISLLRLDTDWYSSTKHEMVHLYPKLQKKGFLIIDDYGHWNGSRKAIDEYFGNECEKPYFNRVDYSCRLIQKN